MMDLKQIAERVRLIRARNTERDADYRRIVAIRRGDYESVAPGLFPTNDFGRPLVANLIDTTARDIAEVMAPLPSVHCQSVSMSSDAERKRNDLRQWIANSYVQCSRLQEQMYHGADRYGTFGFMAYILEPDFEEKAPVIRVSDVQTACYVQDYRGRTRHYFECFKAPVDQICADFPDAADQIRNYLKTDYGNRQRETLEVVRWYDDDCTMMFCVDPLVQLAYVPNRIGKCPVRIVERPSLTGEVRGQFDDVIWVQIARALVQMYTMNALEQSVNAPIAMPRDVNELEIGPFTVVQSDNPQNIQRVPLRMETSLFPEQQTLAQEQRAGSRYPEGRSGQMDASIITGQGVQALMGTFDTQVQTFQRLNAAALVDVIEMAFDMDEAYWGNESKTRRIRDNGAPRVFTYTPSKDIGQDRVVDVTYGAIAGLDPNRGLIFVLQAQAAGLIAKSTARKTLPVDLNADAEAKQIALEEIDDSVVKGIAFLPQVFPQLAANGQDPRDIVMQVAELRKLLAKGKSPVDAVTEVFAPKQPAQPPQAPIDQAMQAAGQGAQNALPFQGTGGASDLLMQMAGMNRQGNQPQMTSSVQRSQPIPA